MKLYSPGDIVRSGLCIGCGICVAISNRQDTRMKFDNLGELKPSGPDKWYKNPSALFTATCPFSPEAKNEDELSSLIFHTGTEKHPATGKYFSNRVGYVKENNYRMQGSSGGLVSWVATELMRTGLVDGIAHVVATEHPGSEGRFFQYRISRNEKEVREGAKSRYYPVELSEILRIIAEVPGRYAVVAVPCMIKALQLLRSESPVFRERIRFTLGLFCGHMKSARFAESFAWQMKVPVTKIKSVEFRHKFPSRPANWYNARLLLHDGSTLNRDWWHLKDGDWGAGFFMNSACNFCDDVMAETADISFGDAWVEPYASDGKGTNVIVIRSPEINTLVESGVRDRNLALEEVPPEFVEQTQAAGLRHRREGLAYRLTWASPEIQPKKRVQPESTSISKERKKIYRMRYMISKWSHRMFLLARKTRLPLIYLMWARMVAAVYYGIAYNRGSIKAMINRYRELGKKN